MSDVLIWIGIVVCMTQSAVFSGANLAVFSLSRLRLEAAAASGDANARRALSLRRDANFTLVTILIGNVAINVLLTLLADSVLAGIAAFLFSTVVITIVGEIVPQAYLSRHALQSVAFLAPVLKFYRVILWPIAKPVARVLDIWIGPELIPWFGERELGDVLRHHAQSTESEVGRVEALGAINFLALDDLLVREKGEALRPENILALPLEDGQPVFPPFDRTPDDPFLRRIGAAGQEWIVIADHRNEPHFVFKAHEFLRDALFSSHAFDAGAYCTRPVIVRDPHETVGAALTRLTFQRDERKGGAVKENIVLVWVGAERRIITGSDLLGCLLSDIAHDPSARPDHH